MKMLYKGSIRADSSYVDYVCLFHDRIHPIEPIGTHLAFCVMVYQSTVNVCSKSLPQSYYFRNRIRCCSLHYSIAQDGFADWIDCIFRALCVRSPFYIFLLLSMMSILRVRFILNVHDSVLPSTPRYSTTPVIKVSKPLLQRPLRLV